MFCFFCFLFFVFLFQVEAFLLVFLFWGGSFFVLYFIEQACQPFLKYNKPSFGTMFWEIILSLDLHICNQQLCHFKKCFRTQNFVLTIIMHVAGMLIVFES